MLLHARALPKQVEHLPAVDLEEGHVRPRAARGGGAHQVLRGAHQVLGHARANSWRQSPEEARLVAPRSWARSAATRLLLEC